MQFRINAQDYIIEDILTHLTNGGTGIAIACDWDYVREGNTLIFTLKENGIIKPDVLFWFGYLTNQ